MEKLPITVLRNQIRGVTGGLLFVGLTFHYTMETWWWGWTLPLPYLVGYALIGLTLIMLIDRSIGFRVEDQDRTDRSRPRWYIVIDFAQILVQSFVASYMVLLLIGIIDFNSSIHHVIRLGLIEVVPIGFGASLANRLFRQADDGEQETESEFPHNLTIFAVGALFVSSTIAPTQEMELIAVHMGWFRHFLLIALTLVLIYLVLYELEFRGQQVRVKQHRRLQVGTVFTVYMVGVVITFFLLMAFGHFIDATAALMFQEITLLAFPASLGAAAAEVVI